MAVKGESPIPDEVRTKAAHANGKMKRKVYEKELHKLQVELCRLQDWVNFPAGGEIIIFDRSWYNRAGVEYVMGFCTEAEHQRFLDLCPQVEKYIVDGGIQLIKVSDEP